MGKMFSDKHFRQFSMFADKHPFSLNKCLALNIFYIFLHSDKHFCLSEPIFYLLFNTAIRHLAAGFNTFAALPIAG